MVCEYLGGSTEYTDRTLVWNGIWNEEWNGQNIAIADKRGGRVISMADVWMEGGSRPLLPSSPMHPA
jgi:hypothetical protein